MNSNTALYLRRGVALGLALLSGLQSLAQEPSEFLRDALRRDLRGQSYILIENNGNHEVIVLGKGTARPEVLRFTPVDTVEALYELVETDGEYATNSLVLALDDPSPEVRIAAIRLLGESLSTDARMALESLLRAPDIELRLEVVESIADNPGASELLRLASENDVETVARTAREYLAERGNSD